jgi:hypothetical protein
MPMNCCVEFAMLAPMKLVSALIVLQQAFHLVPGEIAAEE